MGAHARFMPPHRRVVIEAEIEAHLQRVSLLIARLDRADGDCDLEDNNDAEATNEDGEGHFGQGLYPDLPRYGLNQSSGPTNLREAERSRHKAMMEG